MSILNAENITHGFGGRQILEDASFRLLKGEHIGLIGANGEGKSTFLKILNRETTADSGTFKFGSNVKIGYFDQNIDKLSGDKTVLDEVWDMYRFMTETEIRSALAMFLFRGDDVYKSVSKLSGGERAKLSLLKIMLARPNLLILDEPFSGLDPVNAMLLKSIVKEQIEKGKIVLFSSHQMNYIEEFCDSIAILKDGSVAIGGDLADIKKQHRRNIITKQNVLHVGQRSAQKTRSANADHFTYKRCGTTQAICASYSQEKEKVQGCRCKGLSFLYAPYYCSSRCGNMH